MNALQPTLFGAQISGKKAVAAAAIATALAGGTAAASAQQATGQAEVSTAVQQARANADAAKAELDKALRAKRAAELNCKDTVECYEKGAKEVYSSTWRLPLALAAFAGTIGFGIGRRRR